VAPKYLSREIRKAHQFITFSVNTPVQWGLAHFMKDPENYLRLGSFYQKKRDHFLEIISQSRFKPLACHGTYFQTLSYEGVSDLDDVTLAEQLTKEKKIASIPVSVFCSPQNKTGRKILRFCFAKSEETLEKAGEIICRI
jgi:methionine aminotransferase